MASSIVKSAAQQVGYLLVEESKYLYNVREKMENLQTELEWIECFLRDADTEQHQEKVICKWVSQVRDISYEAEDIIERYLHGVSHHRRDGVRNTLKWFSCILYNCDAWTLHNLGSDIDGLTIKLSDLTSRLKRYGIKIIKPTGGLEYSSVAMEERRTYSHSEEEVVGLEEAVKKVVVELAKIDVKVAGISGTGGLGKTTLARKVFKHKDIKDHFSNNCAWVYISKEFEKGNIFKQILDQLKNSKKENGDEREKKISDLQPEQLAGELYKVLKEKRCLIVVDDIWTEKSWDSLQPAFESISATTFSSKILLTTRNKDLIKYVDHSAYLHPLEHLSEDDSWKLLIRKIAQGSKDQLKLEDEMMTVGREMLKHCGGLPIAIVALGGILSNKKTISGWNDVKMNISSYLMSDLKEGGGGANRVLKVLELSYHNLPFYLKPCFLYMGNFPEDHEISTDRLYHLWEAEGFLAVEGVGRRNRGSVYDVGEIYLNELVQRSMVQMGECWPSGKIKMCRVHDVMRDMCLRKCEEVGFLNYIEGGESDDATSMLPAFSGEIKNLRRVALNDEKGEFLDKHFEHGERAVGVRSLLVFHDQKISSKVWKCFPLLRVLDLEGSDTRSIDGVGHLIHLRYLSLNRTDVELLPACLYDLKYLETLNLQSLWLKSKLRNKFDGMKKLRHLYLPERFEVENGEKLRFPRGGQMETLINFDLERCDTTVLMQMPNLRVFSIQGRYTFKEEVKMVLEAPVVKNEGQLINYLRLYIKGDVIIQDPLILSTTVHHPCFDHLVIYNGGLLKNNTVFPERLTQVDILHCGIGKGVVLSLGELPRLKSLFVDGVVDIIAGESNKLSVPPHSFPQLTNLVLKGQTELEEWEAEEGSLPTLQRFELSGCRKLKSLKNLPQSLTVVKLYDCVIDSELILALEELPHLKSLHLDCVVDDDIPGNKLIFPPGSFPVLTKLQLQRVYECEFGDAALPYLQRLELSQCKKLRMKNIPRSLTEVEFEKCEIGDVLSALGDLPRLQILHIQGIEDKKIISFPPDSFPHLVELHLEWDSGSEWEAGDGALSNLQRLDLKNCKKVINILTRLTQVTLWYCEIGEGGVPLLTLENLPSLQTLVLFEPTVGGVEATEISFSAGSFPHLTQLDIRYAEELKEWKVGDGSLPILQRLFLTGCESLKKIPGGLPPTVQIECAYPCIKGIEKYNTCPHFNKSDALRSKLTSCVHSKHLEEFLHLS